MSIQGCTAAAAATQASDNNVFVQFVHQFAATAWCVQQPKRMLVCFPKYTFPIGQACKGYTQFVKHHGVKVANKRYNRVKVHGWCLKHEFTRPRLFIPIATNKRALFSDHVCPYSCVHVISVLELLSGRTERLTSPSVFLSVRDLHSNG